MRGDARDVSAARAYSALQFDFPLVTVTDLIAFEAELAAAGADAFTKCGCRAVMSSNLPPRRPTSSSAPPPCPARFLPATLGRFPLTAKLVTNVSDGAAKTTGAPEVPDICRSARHLFAGTSARA